MRVLDDLPARKYKARKDWWAIARQLREHAGKWVEVDKDAPKSIAWRINSGEGSPIALRDDPDYTYEAHMRDMKGKRATLYVRATKREEG